MSVNRLWAIPVAVSAAAVVALAPAAARGGKAPRIVAAAMVDANTSASLTVEQIWDLCNAMVEAHGDLLPPALRVQISA